jgi:DNA-binding NarL/FixJ family response regulator
MSALGSTPTRLLVVEQHPVLSGDVQYALSHDPAVTLIAHATSAREATRVARTHRLDLVLCESTLGEPGAVELARFFRMTLPETVVVFFTPSSTENELFEAARVGVAAYLRASMDAHAFLSALRRAAHGEFLIDEEVMRRPTVASRVLAQFRLNPQTATPAPAVVTDGAAGRPPAARGLDTFAPLFVPLSGREIEILDLVARGNSNKLIARRLGISDQTVKNHITTILRKLEVNDRTEAVVFALRNGWISIDSPAQSR